MMHPSPRAALTPEDFALVEDLFAQVNALPPEERHRVLSASLADRPDLHSEVDALLGLHDRVVSSGIDEDAAVATVEVGDTVGAYRLVERIGQGGMGEVFKADRSDGAFDHQVAVKVMRSSVASELVRRFRSERQILASLRHPHIVTLLDGGVSAAGFAYLVMEYVQGQTITAYCQQHALLLNERLKLFNQVCSAVHYAHRHGVVHRDLKPANILVSSDRVAKVLDFGVAKLLDTGTLSPGMTLTQAGLPGPLTPNYASPEQLRGLPLTTSSDVYALGVLLYEMAAGVRPYETAGKPFDEVLRLVLDAEPPRPSAVANAQPAELPYNAGRALRGDLDAIVLRAIAQNSEHRYGSAEELAADIDRHLTGAPISAREPSLSYVVRKLAIRHKAVFLSTGISALLIVAALVATVWQARVARSERDRARVEAAKSAQVADFMRDIFQQSGPTSTRRSTADELLARGRDRIAQLDAQPDVQSMLLLELGVAYRHLGVYDIGDELMARSVTLRERHQGPDALETAQSLAEWGRLLRMAARYDEAEQVLERALSIRERQLGPDHPEVAHSLDALAGVHWNRGRFEQAVSMVARAVTIMERARPDDSDIDRMRGNLGEALSTMGEVGRARAVYEAMLAHAERLGGHEGHNVPFAVLGVGRTLLEDEQWPQARPYLERALRLMEGYYGQKHPNTAGVQALLGRNLSSLGDHVEARRLVLAAVRTREDTLGADHPDVAAVLLPYGSLLLADGDIDGARDVFRRAERIRTTKVGAQSPQLAEVLVELGRLEGIAGRAPLAQSHLEGALAIQRTALVERHRRLVPTLTLLGEALMAQGRTAEARGYCQEAVEISRAKLPPQHSVRVRAEAALAKASS